MNKYFQSFVIIAMSFFLMGFECEDYYSSQNGPYYQGIDTTDLIHLDTIEHVKISVLVWEYDRNTQTQQCSAGASVYFSSADTNLYTDSTGYVHLTFDINTIPFKYSYEVKKDGFTKQNHCNWDRDHKIIEDVTLFKVN